MTTQLGTSSTPSATTVATRKFKIGDQVRVIRKAASQEGGWTDSWVPNMNTAVGKVGTVESVDGLSVQLTIPGMTSKYYYPSFVLQFENQPKQPKVIINAPAKTFAVGQRFQLCRTVDRMPGAGAFSPEHLTLIQPVSGPGVTSVAKKIAFDLAQKNGEVNADQVQEELLKFGFTSSSLGNAAGTLFKGFVNTGKTVKSTREGNRGRRIIVWSLTAQTPPMPITPAKQFVIEFRIGRDSWNRSGNKDLSGRPLSKITFADFAEASKEASRQQVSMGGDYEYRVVPA